MEFSPLIDSAAEFERLLEHLIDEPVIAMDAEMDSFYSYFTKLCLVQVSSSKGDFLLDPLADLDLSPLNQITSNPDQVKVFHAGENDIPYFKKFCDWEFKNVFDTHLAARVLGLPRNGLSKMLEDYFEVEVDKSFQRADWRVRPLPEDQRDYACQDTRYLLELREILIPQLQEAERVDEAYSDFQRILSAELREKEFDPDGWGKIKGANELPANKRGVLQELYLWRDQKARELDRAVFRVAPDGFLLGLARKAPRKKAELLSWSRHAVARRETQALLRCVEKGLDRGAVPLPRRKQKPGKDPLSPRQQSLYNSLRDWRNEETERRGVEPDRVATNRLLKNIALAEPADRKALTQVRGMESWRVTDYGDQILKICQQKT